MKKKLFFYLATLLFVLNFAKAQTDSKPPALDKSPLDISYFPDQYPLQKFQGKISTPPTMRIIYGRPQKDGREIFGTLIKYNEVWRLGANESTEIEFFKKVNIGGKAIPKGRYSMFCIPTQKEWTIIINSDTDNWGAFKYDSKKDLARIKVPIKALEEEVEALTIYFNKTVNGANLIISWDKTTCIIPISF